MPAQGWLERSGRRERRMSKENRSGHDVIFVGAGVIGLACAWRAAAAGARVCVLERDRPAAGSTGVAAGMLAPVGEATWGEEPLLALNLESLRRWPAFAAELEADAELEVDYARCGALHVALDRDEAEELRRRRELQAGFGLESEWLRGSACRSLEPSLATTVRAGVHVPGEASVDPRRLVAALLAALERHGGEVHSGAEVVSSERRGADWRLTAADKRTFEAPSVVLAAGSWSGQAEWVPPEARPPVRPVKGEILTLRPLRGEIVCERIVAGERVYMVPRADGRLVVGATVEERGFDTTITAGGVHELLREAYRLLPDIAELELLEATVGLRPGSPDNSPIIGRTDSDGLLIATGHFRNGVLQAPVTAESVAQLIAGRSPSFDLDPFAASRFSNRSSRPALEVG
jgi:glycine oxidase